MDAYRECMVKPTTTEFAIHSNGRVYVVDATGNSIIRDHMRGQSAAAGTSGDTGWTTVTVMGSAKGDTLLVTSIRK